jgi:murein DD-endopeptidase MepM/ murein hydrolase activator NlpD
LGVDEAKPAAGPDVVSVLKAVPAAVTTLVKPVAGAVTSAFGWRRHPITHEVKFHQGVDLRAAYGQEVQAAAAGRVVFSGDQGGYGATVLVEHADGTRTRYAHLSARLVKKGDQIAAGEPLGRAGKSGQATGTHLHFEVIAPDGTRVAPDQWAGRALTLRQAQGHPEQSRGVSEPARGESTGRNPGRRDGLSAELKVQGVGAD